MRAYYMRVQTAGAAEAQGLMEELEKMGPVLLQRQEQVLLILWPALESDDPEEWDEQTYAELIFFLRAWNGRKPERDLTVLEERPIEVPEQVFQLAS